MSRVLRGSQRRLRQQQERRAGFKELGWLLLLLIFVLLFLIPWLANAPTAH